MTSKDYKKMHEGGFSREEVASVAAAMGIDFGDFTPDALQVGMNEELEHASLTKKEAKKTAQIAVDHLKEDPKYYDKLSKIEKAIGLPSDMDPEHKYIYCTGFHSIKDYWWMDNQGNYWRYTNAPEGDKDHDPKLGEPLVHPEQPMPTENPEFFTDDGFKRHQAIAPELMPQRNPNYDPDSAKELWFEVVESSGLVRYVYLDADVRENLDLWVQYQLRLADASLMDYRQTAYDMFQGEHPQDKVTGVILMLLDQGLFLPELLVDLVVADLEFIDKTVKLGGRKIACDDMLLDFFTSLTQDRQPEDPLFVLQTVHGRNSVGYNYIYAVLNALKMDPNYLLAWHANHMFSRILHRMSLEGIPIEEAGVQVYEELSNALNTTDDVRFLIDTKVRNVLLENYGQEPVEEPDAPESPEGQEEPVAKALTFVEQDSFGVPMIYTDLIERRSDELEFSIWLHAEPMHDISPAEEAEIQENMAEFAEQQEEAPEEEEQGAPAEGGTGGAEGQGANPTPGEGAPPEAK
jgi:hypothetical protein